MPAPSRARAVRFEEMVDVRSERLCRSSGRRVGSADPAPNAGRDERESKGNWSIDKRPKSQYSDKKRGRRELTAFPLRSMINPGPSGKAPLSATISS